MELITSSSITLRYSNMSCKADITHYALQKELKNFSNRNFWCHKSVVLDKNCLNHARNDDFMPSSQYNTPLRNK